MGIAGRKIFLQKFTLDKFGNRLFNEPQKIAPRVISYILSLPALYWDEKKRKRILDK